MSDLNNKTLWMAGAFNHKRQTVRQLSEGTTASWSGIIAKAKAVLRDGNCLVLIISSATSLASTPSAHDLLNAQLSSLVFRKQKRYEVFPMIRTYLEDESGSRFEVTLDLLGIERSVQARTLRQTRDDHGNMPIPAPVACFLMRQGYRKKKPK